MGSLGRRGVCSGDRDGLPQEWPRSSSAGGPALHAARDADRDAEPADLRIAYAGPPGRPEPASGPAPAVGERCCAASKAEPHPISVQPDHAGTHWQAGRVYPGASGGRGSDVDCATGTRFRALWKAGLMYDLLAVLDAAETLLASLTGVQRAQVGIPMALSQQLEAAVILGPITNRNKAGNSLLQREISLYCALAYAVGGEEGDAEMAL